MKKISYRSLLLFLFIISTLGLLGCSENKPTKLSIADDGKNIDKPAFEPIPLDIPEGEFSRVSGWLNNKTIIYMTNALQGSEVYQYDLISGKSKLLYRSEVPIVSVNISPSRKQILIHSSPSANEGLLTVITASGEKLYSTTIESFELSFDWNPYNENLLLVASFTEQWDFDTYVLNINEQTLSEFPLDEPFASWIASNELVYLDWKNGVPALFAPLFKAGYPDGGKEKILSDLIMADAFKEAVMTLSVSEEETEQSVYTFFTNKLEEKVRFSAPLLSVYSGWLVPFYDFILQTKSFYTFQPLESGDADTYSAGFRLVSLDIEKGKETVLMDNAENEPISCSPDGSLCLYGYQLEKMIDVNKQKVFPLLRNDS